MSQSTVQTLFKAYHTNLEMSIINHNEPNNCVRVTENCNFIKIYFFDLTQCLFFVKKQRQNNTNKNAKMSV